MDTGQDDLSISLSAAFSDFLDGFIRSKAHAPAPHLRDNAKTAPEIAPVLYFHQGAGPVVPEPPPFLGPQPAQNSNRQIFLFTVEKNLPNLRIRPQIAGVTFGVTPREDQLGFRMVSGDPVQKAAHIPVRPTSQGAGIHHHNIAPPYIRLIHQSVTLKPMHPRKCLRLVDTTSEVLHGKGRHILS